MKLLPILATLLGAFLTSLPLAAQEQGPKPAVHAAHAMVSSALPMVSQAMLDTLRKGGNAFDAAMVGMLLQTVVEPQMTTVGGAMGFLYYEAKSGKYYYLDAELSHTAKGAPVGSGWVQLTLDPPKLEDTSGRTVAVPGMLAGLKAGADRFGALKWADYFQPAIRVADTGFPMYSFLYGEMANVALTRLGAYPAARAEFLPNGFVPPVGSIVKRPNLAATYRRLAAEGPDYFYRGELGRRFVAAVDAAGGELSMDDLAAYKAEWREPLQSNYKDYQILGSPPPATGGTLISMVLNIVETWDLKAKPPYWESADSLFRLRRAFAFAEDLTDGYVQDPASFEVPESVLLSKEFARHLSSLIEGSLPRGPTTSMQTEATDLHLAANADDHDPHSTDTDQLIVADKDGNMITVTHSVDGPTFGPGIVVDGVVANGGNTFPGKAIGAGKRTVSPFPPTMVAKAGKPLLAIGSPGIASRAVALTLVNYLGLGLSLEQAVDAPRFQGAQSFKPVTIESRVSEEARRELGSRYGVTVITTMPYNWHFGSIQAVAREADGTLLGIADPRRAGIAIGY